MILAGHLNIGPLQFNVQVPEGCSVRYSDPAYAGFYLPAGAHTVENPLLTLPVFIRHEAKQIPAAEPLYRGGKNWAIWSTDSELIICSGFYQQAAARFYCRLSRDFSSAEVALDPVREGADSHVIDGPLRYPIDQILSWGMLARCGGLVLHAAVAVKNGVGCVFAGRSGAGKSTLSAFCRAEGWTILNDDRVIVYKRNNRIMVAGTPWYGSGRFAEAAEAPLGGIYFLNQAPEDRMESMSLSQARLSLMDIAAVPWFEDSWSSQALDHVEGLIRDAVCQRFHLTKSPSAVRALENHQHMQAGVC